MIGFPISVTPMKRRLTTLNSKEIEEREAKELRTEKTLQQLEQPQRVKLIKMISENLNHLLSKKTLIIMNMPSLQEKLTSKSLTQSISSQISFYKNLNQLTHTMAMKIKNKFNLTRMMMRRLISKRLRIVKMKARSI